MAHTMQQDIREALFVSATVNAEDEIRRRVDFLKQYVTFSAADGFVLGISGGQDSSLAGRLCQMAVEELRAETGQQYKFIALRLPYGIQQDEVDAARAIEFIRPDQLYVVDVQPAVDAAVRAFEAATGVPMSDYNKGNQKAQERMTVHYRFAGQFRLLVVGTDHAAEAVVGFFTKYGDGGVDLTPLTGLTKGQGRLLLQHLGADERIYNKAPTADLLDNRPGQLDEDELGISYERIDSYLRGEHLPAAVAAQIEQRYRATEHKRRLPVTPRDTWWHGHLAGGAAPSER